MSNYDEYPGLSLEQEEEFDRRIERARRLLQRRASSPAQRAENMQARDDLLEILSALEAAGPTEREGAAVIVAHARAQADDQLMFAFTELMRAGDLLIAGQSVDVALSYVDSADRALRKAAAPGHVTDRIEVLRSALIRASNGTDVSNEFDDALSVIRNQLRWRAKP